MGWTQYRDSMTEDEAVAELRRLHGWADSERGIAYKIIEDGTAPAGRGERAYYAAVRRHAPGEPSAVHCAVTLYTLHPFGYKDMDENMGPYVHAAPRRVLEALEPLPARDPVPCATCEGTGKLPDNGKWAAHAVGEDCMMCHGEGATDKWDSARAWRKAAWARYGGEPQGKQTELAL